MAVGGTPFGPVCSLICTLPGWNESISGLVIPERGPLTNISALESDAERGNCPMAVPALHQFALTPNFGALFCLLLSN